MEVTNIKTLFSTRNIRFKIPAYQRSYSWGKKQINQFLDDLRQASGQYYLGHFLFEKSADESTLLLIDGQQRLTTCVIFFSSLYNALKGRKDVNIDLEDIQDYYIKDLRKKTQKLETVDDDNNFFIDEIIDRIDIVSTPATRSQERIRQAKEIFDTTFTETTTEELIRWYHLVEEANITHFIVDGKVQAAQIFAFQNDRGKPLSNLEIVKSFLMLQIYLCSSHEEESEAFVRYLENCFSQIYAKIVRIHVKEDDVLNFYWRSRKGYFADDTISSMKKEVLKAEDKLQYIKEFVLGLQMAFQTVEKIENSDNNYVKDLHYLNNMALSYPFFIKADRLQISEQTFNRLAHFLENITFRSLLRGGRADVESRLNHYLTKENDMDKGINEMVWLLKTNGWWGYWSDREMHRIIGNGWFYQNRVDNYLLWKYELYLCNENHPMPHKVTFADLIRNESIEHIAPQTPTDGNPVANGYGEYEGENGIVSGEWLNSVGNLMLISQSHNSSIGNKPFTEKLASYGKDNLLNQQKEIVSFVSDTACPVWDSDAIKRRRDKIIHAAKDVWSLDSI